MSIDKAIDSTALDNGLTTVANAIRTKGGTSEQLAFPQGMAQAIADLPSGGGSEWLLDVQQYTHAEDWTTDALGNSLNFAQTYMEYQQSGNYPFQIAYIENNAVEGNYKAKLVIYYRAKFGANVAQSGRGDNLVWGGIEVGRSFYISAGAKITVLTLYHVEEW